MNSRLSVIDASVVKVCWFHMQDKQHPVAIWGLSKCGGLLKLCGFLLYTFLKKARGLPTSLLL